MKRDEKFVVGDVEKMNADKSLRTFSSFLIMLSFQSRLSLVTPLLLLRSPFYFSERFCDTCIPSPARESRESN